jgi:hypothetical protein
MVVNRRGNNHDNDTKHFIIFQLKWIRGTWVMGSRISLGGHFHHRFMKRRNSIVP